VCGAFCIYCLTVDTAAVVLALSAWVGRGAPVQISWRYRGAFLGLMVVVFGGIMFWRTAWVTRPVLAIHEATLPPTVAAEQRPDKVTVVLFMSITCPHCRAQHAALNEVLAQYGDRVRLVPKLPFRHPSDEQGARAIVCAGGQGKREAMVHDLYNAPFWPNVDRANCESVAAKMGLDLAAYRKCLDAPETEAQVAKDGAAIAEAMLSWVPVTFVGHDRFDGNATAEAIKASIEKALKISGAPPATAGASAR
jgi:protein-disulfide isomerase